MVETPIPVDSAEGMGAKAVPLGLKQVERACGVAQPVIVAQAGREGGLGCFSEGKERLDFVCPTVECKPQYPV